MCPKRCVTSSARLCNESRSETESETKYGKRKTNDQSDNPNTTTDGNRVKHVSKLILKTTRHFVYSCTKYTQNEHHSTSLIKSLLQQICNPVLVCAPPVPANIRLQGHTSNLEREAFPTQDLLHGTVSHNTFEK